MKDGQEKWKRGRIRRRGGGRKRRERWGEKCGKAE